jgi:hypothetical protein
MISHSRGIRGVLRRLGASLVTLLVIAYLTLFGLTMAERGREGLPAEPLNASGEAVLRTFTYITDHPTTYYWHKYNLPALELVATTFRHSAVLLLVSLGAAVALGVPLGIAVALSRRKGGASLVLLFSVIGISTPSFLLAMLFWVVNIQMHRWFDITVLPSAGFGLDAHLIMPALVLAARPPAGPNRAGHLCLVVRSDAGGLYSDGAGKGVVLAGGAQPPRSAERADPDPDHAGHIPALFTGQPAGSGVFLCLARSRADAAGGDRVGGDDVPGG